MNRTLLGILLLFTMMAVGCGKSSPELAKASQASVLPGYQSRFVEVNNLTIHLLEKGTGEVVLFLHGFPQFGGTWDPLMKPLSQKYRVVAPDNRGYGLTQKPESVGDYGIEHLVADVRGLIELLSPGKPVTLIGHDWGGVLAWGTAQQHPELVSKLVVINAPPMNVFISQLATSQAQQEASAYVSKLDGWLARILFAIRGASLLWGGMEDMHEQGILSDDFKAAFFQAWEQPGAAEAAVNWYKANIPPFDAIDETDYWPSKSARIPVPTLLIWSLHDRAFTRDTYEAIPAFVDNLSVLELDTQSHSPFLDHTTEVLQAIESFLHQ